jgi:cytochrome c peroxidase
LRNFALAAPYIHDGSLKDLKQVFDFYIGAGNSHPNLDKEIHPWFTPRLLNGTRTQRFVSIPEIAHRRTAAEYEKNGWSSQN